MDRQKDSTSKIQMVDLGSQYLDIKDRVDSAIQEVIESSSFINGPSVKAFSSNLSKWNQSEFVIPCANGTDGLQVAMMALDLKPGDEVLVPAFTYIATVEVIALLGLTPIFVDVDEDFFNIDVKKIEPLISSKTKAIVPVHLYGQCADMDAIDRIAKENDLFVIEDLAQAIGSRYNGVKAGNLGDIGVTSFFPSKNLGCYGDGGALVTNNEGLADKISMIVNHGQSRKYYHDIVGVNSRLDSIQAAILNEKLLELDDYTARRQRSASIYDDLLSDIEGLSIPIKAEFSTHVYHQYTIKLTEKRDELKSFLQDKGIPSMVYYPLSIPKQEGYKRYDNDNYPISESLCNEVLSIPMHTHLKEDDQTFICKTIKSFFK